MKEIVYPEIGKVFYTKSNRAKAYKIKVSSKEVCVTIPALGTIKQAEKFVLSKKDWIIKTKIKVAEKIIYSFGLKKFNDKVSLNIIPQKEQNNLITYKVDNATEMTILFPQKFDINSDSSQEQIKKCLEKLLSFVAKHYLLDRTVNISSQLGLPINSVKISSAKTRWGSCSYRNDINLSKFLVLLPEHLIDYIIIHELCHTKHRNHGKDFHQLVDFHCAGKEKEFARELKRYRVF
ncbi:M48 family metallopeptidase [Odoribacter sp. OttesenSCG-928-L07]|nr:M48 family metallopeptidase [Odoribacter sp. OttesenSCG-928-L07]MDL2238598.1 M48 family metallopeptidase [Bacteroidales bacterium OttesenSCG-928-L14]MDL2240912.1 M48 family metallopeptidase [Bacteroidales bacterium OttesenSCG-928-K22]